MANQASLKLSPALREPASDSQLRRESPQPRQVIALSPASHSQRRQSPLRSFRTPASVPLPSCLPVQDFDSSLNRAADRRSSTPALSFDNISNAELKQRLRILPPRPPHPSRVSCSEYGQVKLESRRCTFGTWANTIPEDVSTLSTRPAQNATTYEDNAKL